MLISKHLNTMVLFLHVTNEEADLFWVMEDTDIVFLKFTFSNVEISPATQVPNNSGKWSAISFARKHKTFL